ncbi:MAG: hypothetical protein KKD46_02275 [Euryarchaeota archaeon]|nr:hypothetical protein [Euryarchaeota archaeon]MBU4339737.1 hypothetical protein [Euryarchaeota archaeon]MBU4454770.1 hypothetical protein [Euryarchaeota archaeon]MCG2735603.1 hypothetical protein [Candidatus Methanoperedenaceae archaeon]
MLSEKDGKLSQKEFIFRLEEKGWAIKKGKGRSSHIEITEEGKNTFETFIRTVAVKR